MSGLNLVGNGIMGLLGMSRQTPSHERYYSAEELQRVVQESAEAGVLPSEARGLVSGISRRMPVVPETAPLDQVLSTMRSGRGQRQRAGAHLAWAARARR